MHTRRTHASGDRRTLATVLRRAQHPHRHRALESLGDRLGIVATAIIHDDQLRLTGDGGNGATGLGERVRQALALVVGRRFRTGSQWQPDGVHFPTPVILLAQLLVSLACLALVGGPGTARADDTQRPNFIVIYADDLGWRDTGHTGSDFYRTPHIDGLARAGITFTNAYAAAATCAPSRAALLSGRYPAAIGYYGFAGLTLPVARLRVRPKPGTPEYAADDVTIAHALRDAGYQTGMIGKWQLGKKPRTAPTARGFTFTHVIDPKASPAPDAGPKHIDEITRVAGEFIAKNREHPFFLYVSHLAVHTPVEARPETTEKWRKRPPGKQHRHATFAAMIEALDDSVGAILAALEEHGLTERTLVLFTSDNGGMPSSPQTPLRSFKGSYYEGGIRVPFFARWPAVIAPGRTSDVPINQIDVFPTLLAAAGAPSPAGKSLDGVSLLPILEGRGGIDRPTLFWHAPVYTGAGGRSHRSGPLPGKPVSVIRKGDWKLLLFHDRWSLDGGRDRLDANGAVELYDLSVHLDECCDQSKTRVEKREDLLDDLLQWIEQTGAPIADVPNPAYRAPD